MSYKILMVEDNYEVLEATSDFFREEGKGLWEITCAYNGNDALNQIENNDFDLMILDIMLPGVSGFDICKAARRRGDCPIIFLTALGSESNILRGYETGCDDYMVKPFSIRQLYAKCLVLIKRAKKDRKDDILSCGSISLNRHTMTVCVEGSEITINSKEYYLLEYMLINKNTTLSRENILNNVWRESFDVNDRVVDNSVRRLREALGSASSHVKTVIGRGYKLTEEI